MGMTDRRWKLLSPLKKMATVLQGEFEIGSREKSGKLHTLLVVGCMELDSMMSIVVSPLFLNSVYDLRNVVNGILLVFHSCGVSKATGNRVCAWRWIVV